MGIDRGCLVVMVTSSAGGRGPSRPTTCLVGKLPNAARQVLTLAMAHLRDQVGLLPAGPAWTLLRGGLNLPRKSRSAPSHEVVDRTRDSKTVWAEGLQTPAVGTATVECWINSWLLVGVKSPGSP